MAKVSHQLCRSFQVYMGITVVSLIPCLGINTSIARGNETIVAYDHPGPVVVDPAGRGYHPRHDPSCEPSFRGGDCQNCCLDLWQGYCEERRDWACSYPRPYRGLGCLASLRFGRARCSACGSSTFDDGSTVSGCRACAGSAASYEGASVDNARDHSTHNVSENLVQPQVAKGAPRQVASESKAVDPPSNSLPHETAPQATEPSPSADEESSQTEPAAIPPTPDRINFSAEPPSPSPVQLTTVSAKANAGTTRLLRQLATD